MRKRFQDYVLLREMDEKGDSKPGSQGDKAKGGDKSGSSGPGGVSTSLKLGSNNDFQPFVVTDDPRNPEYPSHENLAPIIRAFKDSSKVKVYDSLDPKGQPKPHNLPQKKLFLVGGPVRDHLMRQTPKDLDLATDATPDEIRMILRDAGFKEITDGTRSAKSSGKNESGPASGKAPQAPSGEGTRVFYVKGRDQTGKDFVFGVKVNGQEFDLATFRKDHGSANDGRNPEMMEFGSQADDASRRDLTINSMYLNLTNDNGPNADVSDFHGGVHALMNGNVSFVGNPEDRLGEDNLRALRYARFASKFGKGKVDPNVAAAIKKIGPQLKQSVSPERVREEFLKGLGYEDVDPAAYIKVYKDLGLLDTVFPGMAMKLDKDEDYPTDRDPAMVIAHLLKGNDPQAISQMMKDRKWSNQEQGRVGFLHDILNLSPATDPDTLDRHMTGYKTSGIMDKAVEKWWGKHNKGNPGLIQAFLAHAKGPRVQVVKKGDDTSFPEVDPDFMDLFDIMSGKPKPGMEQEVGKRKKSKEHRNFQDTFRKVSSAPKEKKDDKKDD